MVVKLLNDEYTKVVIDTILDIVDNQDIRQIINSHVLYEINKKRREVFLVPQISQNIVDKIIDLDFGNQLIHLFIRIGFFIQKKFLIGIESLNLLSPFANRRILLNSKATERFIYGRDVTIHENKNIKIIGEKKPGVPIIVCSHHNIPLGYAIIQLEKDSSWLQNIVDTGIYLRAEKSAFKV